MARDKSLFSAVIYEACLYWQFHHNYVPNGRQLIRLVLYYDMTLSWIHYFNSILIKLPYVQHFVQMDARL